MMLTLHEMKKQKKCDLNTIRLLVTNMQYLKSLMSECHTGSGTKIITHPLKFGAMETVNDKHCLNRKRELH